MFGYKQLYLSFYRYPGRVPCFALDQFQYHHGTNLKKSKSTKLKRRNPSTIISSRVLLSNHRYQRTKKQSIFILYTSKILWTSILFFL
jgi:hypothetical protein